MDTPPFDSRISLPSVMVAVFLLLVVLKTSGLLAWSWWWITAPIWGPVALFIVLALIFVGRLFLLERNQKFDQTDL